MHIVNEFQNRLVITGCSAELQETARLLRVFPIPTDQARRFRDLALSPKHTALLGAI